MMGAVGLSVMDREDISSLISMLQSVDRLL
jgi:hypothetical protein